MGLHRNLGTWGLGGLWNGDFRRHLHSGGMGLGDLVTLDTWIRRTLEWGLHWDLVTWGLGGLWILLRNGNLGFGDLQLVTLTWAWGVQDCMDTLGLVTWGLGDFWV